MRSTALCYDELRGYLETIPLVDCHDHSRELGPKPTDPIKAVIDGYMHSDLHSASSDADITLIFDEQKSLEERWPVLERAWERTKYTGYAQVVRRAIRRYYGENELTLAALRRIQEKMIDFSDPAAFERVLDDAKILVRLEDVFEAVTVARSESVLPPRSRLVISLPAFHAVCSWQDVHNCTAPLGRAITSLDEYVAAWRSLPAASRQARWLSKISRPTRARSIMPTRPAPKPRRPSTGSWRIRAAA
jgi:hypothetical protein